MIHPKHPENRGYILEWKSWRGAAQEVGSRAIIDKLLKHSPHIPQFLAFTTLIGCCCVLSPFNRWNHIAHVHGQDANGVPAGLL